MKIRTLFFSCISIVISTSVWAAKPDKDAIASKMSKAFGKEIPVDSVVPGPLPGFYQVNVGQEIGYLSEDGRFLFTGELIDLKRGVNLTEIEINKRMQQRGKVMLKRINKLKNSKMIVMGPKRYKRQLTIFTDVDCPYCAKLHLDVPKLNEYGIQVRYLLFPRSGVGSPTYRRSVAVWCAKDRVKAVGIAKRGGEIEMKTCDNPIEEHYRLGLESGFVRGTPTTIVDDGTVISGYLPVNTLLAQLGIEPKE